MTATRNATSGGDPGTRDPRPALHGARYWLALFVLLALAGFGVVVWELRQLQVEDFDEYADFLAVRTHGTLRYQSRRGEIRDARGRPLAVSVDTISCAIDPARIREIVSGQVLATEKRRDKDIVKPDPAQVNALVQVTIDELFERLAPMLELSAIERDEAHRRVDSEHQMVRDKTDGSIVVRVDGETGKKFPNRFVWIRRHLNKAQRNALEAAMRDNRIEAGGLRRRAAQLRRQSVQPGTDPEQRARCQREYEEHRNAALAADRRWAGILLVDEERRDYPQGTLAGQVLGFTGVGEKDRLEGREGLEARFNDYLTGLEASRPVWRDARSVRLAADFAPPPEETAGQTLELTLDAVIQRICEEELAAAWPREPSPAHRARLRATAVVVDPFNGDLLALAHWPPCDPNAPARDALDPDNKDAKDIAGKRLNGIVSNALEMGSVMKSFSFAAALEAGVLTDLDEPIDCGPYWIGRRVIKDADMREKTFRAQGVLWHSSNPGISRIAARVGPERLLMYLQRFGFGKRTGSLFYGNSESPGLLRELRDWTPDSMGSVPMGYEFMATPLQVALGYCVFANGGWLPAPRLVKAVADADGQLMEIIPPRMRRQAIRRETANTMLNILRGVMVQGTGKAGNIPEYHLAGKSGTAEMEASPAERAIGIKPYSKTRNIANFVAIAPYRQPRIVVSVSIREASQKGGGFVSPVAAGIARRTLEYLMVPHDAPDDYIPKQATIVASR